MVKILVHPPFFSVLLAATVAFCDLAVALISLGGPLGK